MKPADKSKNNILKKSKYSKEAISLVENLQKDYLQRNEYDWLIGVDADVHKSGVAIKKRGGGNALFFEALEFRELATLFGSLQKKQHNKGVKILVIIEAGFLNEKSNWHNSKNIFTAQKISKNVGANHETAKKIISLCEHFLLDYCLVRPNSSKLSSDILESMIGIRVKNQDIIDAIRLII